MANRRDFLGIILTAASASAMATAMRAEAQAKGPELPESDPVAQALGYKMDATKVDKAKFPKYAAGQVCSGCQLYQGKPTDPMAPCPTFANKLVHANGWCAAWVKRAG